MSNETGHYDRLSDIQRLFTDFRYKALEKKCTQNRFETFSIFPLARSSRILWIYVPRFFLNNKRLGNCELYVACRKLYSILCVRARGND